MNEKKTIDLLIPQLTDYLQTLKETPTSKTVQYRVGNSNQLDFLNKVLFTISTKIQSNDENTLWRLKSPLQTTKSSIEYIQLAKHSSGQNKLTMPSQNQIYRSRGSLEDHLGDPGAFLKQIHTLCESSGITWNEIGELDHISYLPKDEVDYKRVIQGALNFSEQITEAQVRGRPISMFKLYKPIEFKGKQITHLEIARPRKENKQGYFDHIEAAVGAHPGKFKKQYPQVTFDEGNLNSDFNPDVALETQGKVIKFHEKPIKEIVAGELRQWKTVIAYLEKNRNKAIQKIERVLWPKAKEDMHLIYNIQYRS